MKLTVYKGFNIRFLSDIKMIPLIETSILKKKDVLRFDRNYRKKLEKALISLDEEDEVWITYEEYSLIRKQVDNAIDDDGLELTIYKNNLFPDYYPLEFEMSEELISEIYLVLNGNLDKDISENCQRFLQIYNTVVSIDGSLFGSFYNFEYDQYANISII